jgi:hypothetical protein
MSIIDKMKKAHPAYWVIGLGGAALAIDYYVEKDKSVASSIYRKFFGGAAGGGGDGGVAPYPRRRAVIPMPGATLMPGSLYQSSQIYYPAFPSVHPYRHWMRRGPIFDHGFGHDWFGHDYGHDWFGHGHDWFGHGHDFGGRGYRP